MELVRKKIDGLKRATRIRLNLFPDTINLIAHCEYFITGRSRLGLKTCSRFLSCISSQQTVKRIKKARSSGLLKTQGNFKRQV